MSLIRALSPEAAAKLATVAVKQALRVFTGGNPAKAIQAVIRAAEKLS